MDVSQLKNELVSEVPTLLQEALNVSIETNEENQLKPQVHEKITLPSNLEEEEIETVKDQKGNFLSFDDLDLEKFEKAREQGVVYSVSGFLGKNQNSDIKCESRHKVHRINFQDSLKGHPCSKTTVTCVERCDSHDKVLYSRKKD